MMKQLTMSGILTLLLLLGCSGSAFSATRPEWVLKGESFMNRKRTNTSYEFKVFKTEDAFLTRLQGGRFTPLLAYLGEREGIDPVSMSLDSLSNGAGEPYTYRIVFPDNGKESMVLAQRIDVFSIPDYNTVNDPIFEYYQLYAVSETNAEVAFDEYTRTQKSKAVAGLLSIVPGAGQLYMGNRVKGYSLLGSEVALGALALSSHLNARRFHNLKETSPHADSFASKERSMRLLRNASLGVMAGIWAFGLYDALTSEPMSTISVTEKEAATLTIAPSPSGAGLALVLRF